MSNDKDLVLNAVPVSIKQHGVIDYSGIEKVIQGVKERIKKLDIDNIEATEDNKKLLKQLRTDLNNELKDYTNADKAISAEFLKPLNEFKENAYKPLKALIEEAVIKLRDGINTVEDKQKEEKRNEVVKYFNDLRASLSEPLKEIGFNLDFVSFDHLDLNITLTTTETALKKQVKDSLESISNDLRVIAGHENKSRLYAKYSVNLNLGKALYDLQEELKREEIVLNTLKPKPIEETPKEELKEETPEVNKVEEILEIYFKINDTKLNIAKVRKFLIENDITYEMQQKK